MGKEKPADPDGSAGGSDGRGGAGVEQPPAGTPPERPDEEQAPTAVEAFDEEGAGIAAKE
jgi:hypothetical protein